ncbi:MAG: helix-hairpin-helix domain-containing protein [Bacteroidales bacterium]
MSLYFKKLLEKAGFRRSEKRASFILMVLVSLLILGRILFTPGPVKIISSEPLVVESEPPVSGHRESNNFTLFRFDPNKAGGEQLKLLGIPERQVKMILNYRNKGGNFKSGSDLSRIYGFDTVLLAKLLPYICIDTTTFSASRGKHQEREESRKAAYKIIITDLNSCDSAELERLPAIGPVLASRIIRYRKLLGGYCNKSQLSEVYGMSDSIMIRIEPLIMVKSDSVRKTDLNTAGYKALARHPYLTRYEVQSILKFRSLAGHIDSIGQLVRNGILDSAKAERISPYFIIVKPSH